MRAACLGASITVICLITMVKIMTNSHFYETFYMICKKFTIATPLIAALRLRSCTSSTTGTEHTFCVANIVL